MNYKILVLLITTLIIQSYAQSTPCKNYKFKQNLPNAFKTCIDLPQLGSSLHYTYNPTNATLEIAYRHPGYSPGVSKWVAWAINPTAKGMVGSQTLVGLRNPKDGSIIAYTSPINSYGTKLEKGELSFEVTGLKAELINEEMIIFANIKIPDNKTEINQVWNEGGLSDVGNPKMHFATNIHSMASLNVLSGVLDHNAGSGSKGIDASTLRWIHGTINGVSWGILIPVGTLIARHVKVIFPSADPAWFYLHVGCQLSAYILGTVGFIIGLKLTSGAHHVHHPIHRYLGIAIFSVATLQMSALLYRPKKDDANRKYWSTIHHLNGHIIEIMGIINIFRGLKLIYIDHDTWIINFIIYVIIITAVHIGLNILSLVIVAKRNKSQSAPLDFIFFKL